MYTYVFLSWPRSSSHTPIDWQSYSGYHGNHRRQTPRTVALLGHGTTEVCWHSKVRVLSAAGKLVILYLELVMITIPINVNPLYNDAVRCLISILDNNFLRWTYFGTTKFIHSWTTKFIHLWTTLAHATLCVSNVINKLADVTFA